MFDDFDAYSVDMDSECFNQDFDDVDLYGTRLEENEYSNSFGNEIELN